MDGASALKWIIDITMTFSQVWSWISTPLFNIGSVEVSFLGIFSTAVIVTVLSLKIANLFIPI